MDKNFKAVYLILKYLEAAMDCPTFDPDAISPQRLGITRTRWEQILWLMQDEGYIKGVAFTQSLADDRPVIVEPIHPTITLKGLEYFTENAMMKKVGRFLKGAVDTISKF